jgi:hypothetical protein
MSKQIAILLDNSGSMFSPVGGSNPNTKIYETARGAQYFIENLIDELAANPGAQFAISTHRFASSYQLLPGGAQIDTSQGNFLTALGAMRGSIAAIENQAASQSAVGDLTDIYDSVRRVSDFLDNPGNQPGFGAPTSKVIFLFTDGLQTISHGGSLTKAGFEGAEGVTFQNLLRGRGIKLVAWGSGSDALGEVLAALAADAVQGGMSPVSESKVLFPIDETGTFENCTAIIATNAFQIVSNNSILPLAPVGQPPSGLLWEQFSLPRFEVVIEAELALLARAAPNRRLVNFRDFEVHVDGSVKELILGLVAHAPGSPSIEATSPSGVTFSRATAGARSFAVQNAQALKVPNPEEGKWLVRVTADRRGKSMVLDLMARGVQKEFSFEVKATPRNLPAPGKVELEAFPRLDGKPAKGKLAVKARVLGGASLDLEANADGSFSGTVEIDRPGLSIIVFTLDGKLASGKSIRRVAFAVVLLGRATDPRFSLSPDTYEQGQQYDVDVTLFDARFKRSSQIRFGEGIQVLSFDVESDSFARASIRVAPDAFVGFRTPVTYNPQAESLASVRVVAGRPGPDVGGKVRCLVFDECGNLVGVVLTDGTEVPVSCGDEKLRKILETARDQGLSVRVERDASGRLKRIEICRS